MPGLGENYILPFKTNMTVYRNKVMFGNEIKNGIQA
jgi:hypothetical protein